MDCIICSDKVGFTSTLVIAKLNKPTPLSCVSHAAAPWLWCWPSAEPLLIMNILLVPGEQFHILSPRYLLKICLYRIHKAHLRLLFPAVLRSLSVFCLGVPLPSPLRTLPIIPTTALGPSGSLGQHNLFFCLQIPCPHETTGTEQASGLSPCYPTISFQVCAWIKYF